MRLTLCLCVSLVAVPAIGQRRTAPPPKAAATSDTRITVNGSEAFTLPQMAGDWFATPSDAHVAIRLNGASARLDLQLDGRNPTQTLTAENDSDLGGAHVGFFWHSPGHDVRPRGSEAITVQVVRLDDTDFEGRLSGSAEGVALSGSIHLHREAPPAAKLTGSFGDCDNVIHDKFALAQNRSPSDCEVKFDRMVRDTIDQALRPVARFWTGREWTVVKQSPVKPITNLARRTEQAPYRLDSAPEGVYAIEFQLTGAAMTEYQHRLSALSDRIAAEIGSGKPGASMQEVTKFGYEMEGATRLRVSVSINAPSVGIASYSGGHAPLQIPGAAFATAISHVPAATGGGPDNSHDESVILLGTWSAPAVQPQGDGGEHISVKGALNNAAALTVQNIVIRIQANPANARQAAAQIDLALLDRLLHGR
jgi:hypothetical protein